MPAVPADLQKRYLSVEGSLSEVGGAPTPTSRAVSGGSKDSEQGGASEGSHCPSLRARQ